MFCLYCAWCNVLFRLRLDFLRCHHIMTFYPEISKIFSTRLSFPHYFSNRMQRWLAECKQVGTENSRNRSGTIFYAAETAHYKARRT